MRTFTLSGIDNERLRERVLEHERQHPGSRLGVADGKCWSGPKDLFDHPDFAPLIATIEGLVLGSPRWNIVGWGNVTRSGGSIGPHAHTLNEQAGVYYPDPGDGFGGQLIVTPYPDAQRLTFDPKTGLLVTFPGFAVHQVTTYIGDSPRISIAWNADRRH